MAHFRSYATSVTAVALATLALAGCRVESAAPGPAPEAAPEATPAVERGEMCGETRGPTGSLMVHTLDDSTIDCTEALRIADAFSPQIALGEPVTVEGWDCTFPSTPGLLARCDSDGQAIGFYAS